MEQTNEWMNVSDVNSILFLFFFILECTCSSDRLVNLEIIVFVVTILDVYSFWTRPIELSSNHLKWSITKTNKEKRRFSFSSVYCCKWNLFECILSIRNHKRAKRGKKRNNTSINSFNEFIRFCSIASPVQCYFVFSPFATVIWIISIDHGCLYF